MKGMLIAGLALLLAGVIELELIRREIGAQTGELEKINHEGVAVENVIGDIGVDEALKVEVTRIEDPVAVETPRKKIGDEWYAADPLKVEVAR